MNNQQTTVNEHQRAREKHTHLLFTCLLNITSKNKLFFYSGQSTGNCRRAPEGKRKHTHSPFSHVCLGCSKRKTCPLAILSCLHDSTWQQPNCGSPWWHCQAIGLLLVRITKLATHTHPHTRTQVIVSHYWIGRWLYLSCVTWTRYTQSESTPDKATHQTLIHTHVLADHEDT